MALTIPVPLALGRFKQIPQRTQEVWQGGLVRLPMWVAHPTDPERDPSRPTGAVWVSLRTGLIHVDVAPEGRELTPLERAQNWPTTQWSRTAAYGRSVPGRR